jgi:hypothetical protein
MRHNYAQSGSFCSSTVIGTFLPGIKENQLPAFQADLKFQKDGASFLNLPPKDTVYTIWIGTNDLGAQGLLPKADAVATVPKYVECVFGSFDNLYGAGGRKFVLMNVIPLNLLPMYTVQKGKGADGLYPNKPGTVEGLKQANKKLEGMVLQSNQLFANISKTAIKGPKPRYPEAELALYDVYKFVSTIHGLISNGKLTQCSSLTSTKTPNPVSRDLPLIITSGDSVIRICGAMHCIRHLRWGNASQRSLLPLLVAIASMPRISQLVALAQSFRIRCPMAKCI